MIIRRWLWLVLAAVVAVGLARLRFDVNVLGLLPASLPEVRGLAIHQEVFEGSNDLLICLENNDAGQLGDDAESLAEYLRSLPGLTSSVRWRPPWEEHPDQAAELTAAMWFNQSPARMAELVERLEPESLEAHLESLQNRLAFSFSPEELTRLSYDPLGLLELPHGEDSGLADIAGDGAPFRSPDGTFRVVFVEPPMAMTDYRNAIEWSDEIQSRVAEWQRGRDSSTTVAFTGGPTFNAEISSGMERDMTRSILSTTLIVSVLFLVVHRRLKPLIWLLVLLSAVLATTMGVCGLILGPLNVISLGFAAILLGLAVDYGLVLYQERSTRPDLDLSSARSMVAPGIIWSACTTAFAFGLLNFAGLEGLAQLGTLVAAGVLIAAGFILLFYLPPLETSAVEAPTGNGSHHAMAGSDRRWQSGGLVFMMTLLLVVLGVTYLVTNPPLIDSSSRPLRPARSPAYDAMDKFEARITSDEFRWLMIVTGESEQAVADELSRLRSTLSDLETRGLVEKTALPDLVWANPEHQKQNRPLVSRLLERRDAIFRQVEDAGFTDESLALARAVFDGWSGAVESESSYWPDNEVSHWVVGRTAAHQDGRMTAVGQLEPTEPVPGMAWEDEITSPNVIIAGWDRLGPALMDSVRGRLQVVVTLIALAVLTILYLTFRSWQELVLSVVVLLVSGVMLLTAMSWFEWEWNLMNLMAIPLLLGSTVDYTIHTQLSLRRSGGDVFRTFNSTGKALLLCAATTAVGFGSLGFSNNAGLASLGRVCALGTVCSVLVACFLLPGWWTWWVGSRANTDEKMPDRPSRLYGPLAWRVAGGVVGCLPLVWARWLGGRLALIYCWKSSVRRAVVHANLEPVLGGDLSRLDAAVRQLFVEFGVKIVDLLYFERGGDVIPLFSERDMGKGAMLPTRAKEGTLLVTPHLGNWEYGAPSLKHHGIDLLVISNPEPGVGFTEQRRRTRERWGIETIVIGDGEFAFVEVLKRLQEGAAVALLIDRPRPESSIEVEMFGQPFRASVAAAELARASGCRVLPVAIPRDREGYRILMGESVAYDRVALRDREARQSFTQEIVRALEAMIRQYPEQWFHFVPIWPEAPRR